MHKQISSNRRKSRQITKQNRAKLPNEFAPNCQTNPRQITKQIRAKLPNLYLKKLDISTVCPTFA